MLISELTAKYYTDMNLILPSFRLYHLLLKHHKNFRPRLHEHNATKIRFHLSKPLRLHETSPKRFTLPYRSHEAGFLAELPVSGGSRSYSNCEGAVSFLRYDKMLVSVFTRD